MLETYIELDQIDLILDFDPAIPHDPSWDPQKAIDSYIKLYNEKNAFPYGIFKGYRKR